MDSKIRVPHFVRGKVVWGSSASSSRATLARAAFFDLTIDARWGGNISGDNIRADLEGWPCGRSGPSIHRDIVRYVNKTEGAKITCAGTMDAYVRGFIED